MIYINKINVREREFVHLLESTRRNILLCFRGKKQAIAPATFETLVYEQMSEAARKTTFDGKVVQTGDYAFPDIIANKFFGVEVKYTTQDHWQSTGNSVLESNRIDGVERIFMFFGKFGGTVDIKYRLYQECLIEVSVTHSPRYRIDMNLSIGQTIFDKIGVSYNTLRHQKSPIETIKDYYRKQLKDGEELWWIDQDSESKSVSPIIRPFRNLTEEEQTSFIVKCFILFPEMFSNSQTKFERAAAYLIAEHNAISPNLRDIFTAGGKVELSVNRKKVLIPQIYANLKLNLKRIKQQLKTIDRKTLQHYWKLKQIDSDRFTLWAALIDKAAGSKSTTIKPSMLFKI